jgi:hypothetical protein
VVRETLMPTTSLTRHHVPRRGRRHHGMRGRKVRGGDEFFRPWGSCSVMFVTSQAVNIAARLAGRVTMRANVK